MKLEDISKKLNMFVSSNLNDIVEKIELELSLNDDPELRVGLAMLYEQLGRYDEQVRCYEKVLESQPENPISLTNLGSCYINTNPKKAHDFFKRVILNKNINGAENSTLSLAHTNIGVLYEKRSFYELAYEHYKIALRINPDNKLAIKYLKQLKDIADSEYGPVGLRMIEGKAIPWDWDSGFMGEFDNKFEKQQH